MRIRFQGAAGLLLALTLAGVSRAQLVEDYRFKGKVVDTKGNSVPEASLTLRNPASGSKIVWKANKEGSFDRRMIPKAKYELIVEKEGYVTQRQVMDWSAASEETVLREATITLETAADAQARDVEKAKAELGKKTADLYRQAYEALSAGDCATATAKAQEVLAAGAGSVEYAVRFVLARCLATGGDQAAALAEYKKVLELKPDLFEARFDIANVHEGLGQHDEAVAAFQGAAELKPDDAETQYNMGAILFRQVKIEAARPHLERAVALNPAHANATKALAFALLAAEKKDMQQAKALLMRYLELAPGAGDTAQITQIVKEIK